jgi:putative transposase
MPVRKKLLVKNQVYHIFNHGVNRQPIFNNRWDYQRALLALFFYHFNKPPISLSTFLRFNKENQQKFFKNLVKKKRLVDIYSFCLMPNHFHLLLRQNQNRSISRFLSDFQNSYTKYFNARHKRIGHLFQGQFKAVWIETDEQLLHVSRYIHLNPYSSYIVKDFEQLKKYQWSSMSEYLGNNVNDFEICRKDYLLSLFKSSKEFERFIFDQKDYQRELQTIKHLALEKV